MNSTVNLGKIFGIQFKLHYSWLIIFMLVTAFLALQVFPESLKGETRLTYWIMGAVSSLLFFVSVLTHELSHSLIGKANDIPMESITLFIFGGAAQMGREPRKATDEFKMAFAGPLMSLIVAGFFWAFYLYCQNTSEVLAITSFWLAQINLILAIFNLLPGFPLDGGRILRASVWHFTKNYTKATHIATIAGRIVGFLLIAGGLAIMIRYQDILGGVWLGVIGLFLENAARDSYRQALLQQALKGYKAVDIMATDCPNISGDTLLSQLIEQGQDNNKCFLITEEGRAVSALALHNIQTADTSKLGTLRLKDIAQPLDKIPVIAPDQDVLEVAISMNENNSELMAVMNDNKLAGMITLDMLIELSNRHSENE